jgi:hypothetical protein
LVTHRKLGLILTGHKFMPNEEGCGVASHNQRVGYTMGAGKCPTGELWVFTYTHQVGHPTEFNGWAPMRCGLDTHRVWVSSPQRTNRGPLVYGTDTHRF